MGISLFPGWFVECASGIFANVLGAECEEDSEESAGGHSQFTRGAWEARQRGCAGIEWRSNRPWSRLRHVISFDGKQK